MNTNNSISNSLKKLLEINSNSLKIYERINEAITTDLKDVPLEVITDEGATKTVYVPSFGFMKRELERLDTNLKALTGLGKGNTKIKLPDGTYQNIVTSRLKAPANDISSLIRPSSFTTKSNYFFEDFLNPLLTTTLDVTGQIPNDTERVLVKRIIFDSTNVPSVEFFKENYKNQEGVDYYTALRDIANNNLTYIVDEEVRDLPYRVNQYIGKFDVLSIDSAKKDVIVDGTTVKRSVKLITLDKLTYSDNDKDLDQTELLKVGDELMVNSGNRNTRYKISKIDGSTRQIEVQLVEGYDPIKIGADVLSVYKYNTTTLNVEISLGFNERVLLFVKAIDSDSGMLAENWSPGIGFYTNEMILLQEDGSEIRLDDYYKDNVADFGQYIKALKEDAIPPATVGVTPDAPTLEASNFKVVQINSHLTQNDTADKIKKLSADKTTVDETIKKLDDTIAKKRTEISTKKYESDIQKDKDKSELNALIEERASETKLYNSLVNQIQSLASGTNVTNIAPKYRVRGFWAVPSPKKVADTTDQNVVQFAIQYRYLSTSGKAGEVAQLPFTDGTREKTAVFSNWNEIRTKVRDRARNEDTGKFEWQESLVEDGQEINFNQLDIAINEGELVEIRVKSVSEAGYPANPIFSDWSEPVTVDFPEAEIDTTDLDNLVEKNLAEVAAVKISDELTAKGVYTHVDESFTANETYYAHTATNIASGFLSPEQKPVSVFDKLTELENQIRALKEGIEAEVGELVVKLQAEDGTVTIIKNNTVNQIFAGYYVDEVAELSVKKGHIVTKTFKLLLENTKATQLELVSRLTGDRNKPAYKSSNSASTITTNGFGTLTNDQGTTAIDTKVESDTYYTTEGKYDLAPIQFQNISSTEISTYELLEDAPYQSAQRRGQFVYSRYMDIANQNPHYITSPLTAGTATLNSYEYTLSYATFEGTANNISLIIGSGDGTSSDFIWTGTFGKNQGTTQVTITPDLTQRFDSTMIDVCSINAIGAANYNSGLYFHKDHPDLENIYAGWTTDEDGNSTVSNPTLVTNTEQQTSLQALINNAGYSMPITATLVTGTSFKTANTAIFGSSAVDANPVKSKQQLAYQYTDLIAAGARSFKMSFDANDQYLLGGRSCGAFLYLSPINLTTLSVDGETKQSRKQVKGRDNSTLGNSNALSLDVVFQYRMTDYFGNDPSSDVGRIGGQAKLSFPNLTYTKKIGLDIFDKYDAQFSFDLEVFAKYSPKGKNLNSIRAAQLVRNVPTSTSLATKPRLFQFESR